LRETRKKLFEKRKVLENSQIKIADFREKSEERREKREERSPVYIAYWFFSKIESY
jgi:hypothetical protein